MSGQFVVECSPGRVSRFNGPLDAWILGWGQNDDLIAVVSREGAVQRWSLEGKPLGPARALDDLVLQPMLARGGGRLLLGAILRDRLSLWDATTGAPVATCPLGFAERPERMELDVSGDLLAAGDQRTLRVWALGGSNPAEVMNRKFVGTWSWDWCPADGSLFFMDRDLLLRSWRPGGDTAEPRASIDQACSIRWHPQGTCLAVGRADGAILLLHGSTFEVQATLSGHTSPVKLLAWNHDGHRLASADERGALCIWDAVRPRLLLTLTATSDAALARTPGGYCDFLGGAADAYRLAVAPEPGSDARIYVPVGGLRDVLHQPDKVSVALCGDLSGDNAEAELERLGYLNGVPGTARARASE